MPGSGERGWPAKCLYCGEPFNPQLGSCPVCGGPYVLQLPAELLEAIQQIEEMEAAQYLMMDKGFHDEGAE